MHAYGGAEEVGLSGKLNPQIHCHFMRIEQILSFTFVITSYGARWDSDRNIVLSNEPKSVRIMCCRFEFLLIQSTLFQLPQLYESVQGYRQRWICLYDECACINSRREAEIVSN